MIEFHAIAGQQRVLIAQVVDGKLVLPPEPVHEKPPQEITEIQS